MGIVVGCEGLIHIALSDTPESVDNCGRLLFRECGQ